MRVRWIRLAGFPPGINRGLPSRLAALAAGFLLLAALLPLAALGQNGGQVAGPPPGSRIPLTLAGQPVGHLMIGDVLTFVRAGDDAAAFPTDKLVLLELAVTNVTAAPVNFDLNSVALLDDAGASHRARPELQITSSDDDGLFGDDDIAPGTTERGWLGYAIPAERAAVAAVFEDDDDSTPPIPLANLTVAQVSAGDDDDGRGDDDDGRGDDDDGLAGNETGAGAFGDDDDGLGDDDDGILGNEAGLGDDDDGFGDDDDGIAGNEGVSTGTGAGTGVGGDDDDGGGFVGGGGGWDDDDGGGFVGGGGGDDDDGGGGDDDDGGGDGDD